MHDRDFDSIWNEKIRPPELGGRPDASQDAGESPCFPSSQRWSCRLCRAATISATEPGTWRLESETTNDFHQTLVKQRRVGLAEIGIGKIFVYPVEILVVEQILHIQT